MERKQNWLTIMVGLPRSGKSTWAEVYKKDAVVVSPDWIRENILGESYSYSESANAIVWAMADATLRIVLGQGLDAFLDGANLTRSTRRFYVDLARRHGARVRMLFVPTPLEVCIERNRTSTGHKLPEEKLVQMAAAMERPTDAECDDVVFAFPESEPTAQTETRR